MDLYLKAGPDGKSVGDCPFAHYVRMVLHAKVNGNRTVNFILVDDQH